MHEPPFSPTAAPYPVTINLSPTRKDTTKRHWQQPLVTGVQEITGASYEPVKAKLEGRFWWLRSCTASYHGSKVAALRTFEKPLLGGFSFSEQEITTQRKGSQEDPSP
jgi:hypothetical protein